LVYLVVQSRRDREDRQKVVTTGTPTGPVNPPAPGLLTPSEVIRMRYARGEITREEFEILRQDLG